MIAEINHPSSRHHTWRRFSDGECGAPTSATMRAARKWIRDTLAQLKLDHPSAFPMWSGFITEREANKVKYRCGTYVFRNELGD